MIAAIDIHCLDLLYIVGVGTVNYVDKFKIYKASVTVQAIRLAGCCRTRKSQYFGSKMIKQAVPLLHLAGEIFVLFGSSTNWMRPIHIKEGNQLCLLYQFKCKPSKNTLTETPTLCLTKYLNTPLLSQVDI